jgi:steroid delta-isomerase-like uncharacterized protein
MRGESEQFVRDVFEHVFNAHDADRIDDYFAEDYAHDGPIAPGRDHFKEHMREFFEAFPDLHGSVEELVSDGDRVACRSRWTGTHRRELMGIPATDRTVDYRVIEIFRIEDGRIAGHVQQADTLTLFTQLGLLPEPAIAGGAGG